MHGGIASDGAALRPPALLHALAGRVALMRRVACRTSSVASDLLDAAAQRLARMLHARTPKAGGCIGSSACAIPWPIAMPAQATVGGTAACTHVAAGEGDAVVRVACEDGR